MIGYIMRAAGAIEVIIFYKVTHDGIVSPPINADNPDPEYDLDYVANITREKEVDIAISNSFGFAGHKSAVASKRYL